MQYLQPLNVTVSKTEAVSPTPYGVVSKTLEDNCIYVVDPAPALTSIVLMIGNTFRAGIVDFITGSTPPTFGLTSGFTYIGANCSANGFTPVANKHYRIALQYDGITKLAYVESL